MNNATILLVEDNQDHAALTVRALKMNNIRNKVFVVGDGLEALDFLFGKNAYVDRKHLDLPQLTLLDINLPKMNGLEVLRRLREEERTRFLPVVMLSSSNEREDIAESYRYGANSYLQKSIDYTEFMESIRQLGLY
jgi:CheY-like chemotaxis protein